MFANVYEFMKNEKWFEFDKEKYFVYILKDDAPETVFDDYFEYLGECLLLNKITENTYFEIKNKILKIGV